MLITDNLSINEQGHLAFAGMDTVELAQKYQTPLYLMDEDKIRTKCRMFRTAVAENFQNAEVLYASKANSFVRMYEIIKEEGLSADVVSGGELYTALHAGFPAERIYFHGNNKSQAEIAYAVQKRIGCFVTDNLYELENLDRIAGEQGVVQNILLRITPGIDPHTFDAVATGKVDSKFGFAIATGQAEEAVRRANACKNIHLLGYHCHIGSQVFEHNLFSDSANIMLEFSKDMKEKLGFEAEVLNLGGGFGIRYVEQDAELDIQSCIATIAETVKKACKTYGLREPKILFEPGRSMVGDCGITLYTVGNIKEIPGYKKYVAIDGGMADNPRYALYRAKYTAWIANRATEERTYRCTIAGKCCESGDLIQEDTELQTPHSGDILAVLATGAYNYSMASNYNKLPRPPIVMVKNQEDYLAVRRESYEDLIKNELR